MTTERDSAVGFGLPRRMRLLTRRDFQRVYRRGARARGANLTIVACPRREPGFRLGLSVSKANGAAVRRNKIKRIFREAFRLERPTLPGSFDLVLIPQLRDRYHLAEVRRELEVLLRQILDRPPRRRGRRPK